MMKALTLTIWLICGFAASVPAQQQVSPTPRPTLPQGPPLGKAPDFAQWSITITTTAQPTPSPAPNTDPQASQPPAATPGRKPSSSTDRQITVVKTGRVRFEQTVEAGGAKSQKWCVPDMQATIRGSGPPLISLPGNANDAFYVDYSKTDFGGFEWIAARNFEGIQKVKGQDCLVFRDKIKLDPGSGGTDSVSSVLAYIHADSRLPIALQIGDETRVYQFGAVPAAVLTLPADVQKLMDQWRKTLHQAALIPAKP